MGRSVTRLGVLGEVTTEIVLPSITMAEAEGNIEMVVPETVIAEPPGVMIWVPIVRGLGPAGVKFIPVAAMLEAVDDVLNTAMVLPPIVMAVAESGVEMTVPETSIADPPGVTVCEPMTSGVVLAGVRVMPAIVIEVEGWA